MQPIQQQFKAKCIKGNTAAAVCANPICKESSLMCMNKLCQCMSLHLQCQADVFLNKLQSKFKSKHLNTRSLLSEIYNWYQNQSKQIAIEMDSLKKIIDSQQFILFGEEEKLYSYLVEGKSDLIIPSLAFKIQKILYNKNKSYSKISEKIKKQMDKQDQKIKQIFQNIKVLVEKVIKCNEIQILPNYKFSQKTHHPYISIVNDKTAKTTNYVSFGLALVEPSLLTSDSPNSKIKIKIIRAANSQFMFGVCQLTSNFNGSEQSINNLIQYGSFTYHSCSTYVGNNGGHRKQSNNIQSYSTNDYIQIEYWRETNKVEVRNMTKNTKSVSFIQIDSKLPLYFGVLLTSLNDEVKIIDEEQKQQR